MVVETCGSDFDTLLGVYTGTPVGSLTAVASNDDACGSGLTQSRVVFTATAGQTYRIAVDGYNNGPGAAQGNVYLQIAVQPTYGDNFNGPTSGRYGLPSATSATVWSDTTLGATSEPPSSPGMRAWPRCIDVVPVGRAAGGEG